MRNIYQNYLSKINTKGKSSANIEALGKALGISFPVDYLEFMQEYNGGEGEIANSYVILWSAEDLTELNEAYAVNEFAPGLVLFGSDGGDLAYAFDVSRGSVRIVEVPFIGMDIKEIKDCANSFVDFLEYLSNR
jgi:SMI1 / KNR4 family.